MSLRGLLTRLEKLEAAIPPPVAAPAQAVGRMERKLNEIVAAAKRFPTLTPRQKIIELRAKLRTPRSAPANPSGLSARLDKIDLCFRDVTEGQLRDAELALLAELGHPNARHPLNPEHQEILDLELFDA